MKVEAREAPGGWEGGDGGGGGAGGSDLARDDPKSRRLVEVFTDIRNSRSLILQPHPNMSTPSCYRSADAFPGRLSQNNFR